MTEHVKYIEKTRAYYRNEGYTRDYAWASNETAALTPLPKPLKDCRLGLVSTASLVPLGEHGEDLETPRIMGSNKLEVFDLPTDWPAGRVRSASEDHDRFQSDMSDLGAYLPKDMLAQIAEEGLIGGFADTVWRILPNYSKRKITNVDAPEILARARAAGVDAMVLTPV
ncbi:MAG: hypothetical protein AAF458_17760 [Pseudomonadota bacterium]